MGTCDYCGIARSELDVIDDSSDTGMSQLCFACHPDQNFIKENYMHKESELTLHTDSIPTNNIGLQSAVDTVCQYHGMPDIKICSIIEFDGNKGCIVGGDNFGRFIGLFVEDGETILKLCHPGSWMRIYNIGDLIYISPNLLNNEVNAENYTEQNSGCSSPHDPAIDMVNSPPHYTQGKIECVDAIRSALTKEEFDGWCKGNAMKYIWRHRHKGDPKEQIKKALWYLNKMSESDE